MKIFQLLLKIFCLSGLLFSCHNSNLGYEKVYSNKVISFHPKENFRDIIHLKSEKLPLNYDSIIYPGDIDIINNYLILLDQKKRKPFSVFDLEDFSFVGSYGSNGQGPGEIMSPIGLSHIQNKDNNSFFIYDLGLKKILGYSVESLLKDRPLFEKKINQSGYCSGIAINNNDIYYRDLINSNYSFSKLDTITNALENFGSLLYNDKGVTNSTFSQACQANIISKNNIVVLAYLFAPYFEIFDTSSDSFNSILAIDKFSPIYKEISSAEGKKMFAVIENQTKIGLVDLQVTDKYIYLLYSGNIFSLENLFPIGDKLLVFDYAGNPINYYETDVPIYKFKVIEDNYFIALSSDNTVEVLKFNL